MSGVIRIILSGGQAGVDRAAHRAAMEVGILSAGWCPPGRTAEDGVITAEFPLTQTPQERSPLAPDIPRSQRTEWNVRDSDGTLILRPSGQSADPGTDWTIRAAAIHRKPCLTIDPNDNSSLQRIVDWLHANEIRNLNIAGPSEGTSPGIGQAAHRFLTMLFSQMNGHKISLNKRPQ